MTRKYNLYVGNGTNKKIEVTGEKTILNFVDMSYEALGLPSGTVNLDYLGENYVYRNNIIIPYGPYGDRVVIKNYNNFSYAQRPNFIIRTTDGDKNIADMFDEVVLNFDEYDDEYDYLIKDYIGTIFNDRVIGNYLSNKIKGGAGNDSIYGNAGKDKLYGGIGNDYIDGGIGNDYLYGNSGNDEIHAGEGVDYINGGSGNNTIYGDTGKCTIVVGNGNNDITGSSGYNKIVAGNGHNTIVTYDGNDYIKVGNGSNNNIDAGGGTNTIILGKGKNNIVNITSGGISNISYNRAGSLILGIDSSDITGLTRKKSDLVVNTYGGSARVKNFFSGTLKDIGLGDGSSILEYTAMNPFEFVGDMEKSNKITGTILSDLITGGNKADVLKGKNGHDKIDGGYGNDKIYGGSGNDVINGDDGNDVIYGDSGNDEINGGYGNDKIYGGKGNDIIDGGEGNNTIYGDSGNDEITCDDGDDKIYGGSGNDIIYSGNGKNIIYGGSGNDEITCGDGNDKIYGGTGNDTIDAGEGNNTIYIGNNAGNDFIVSGMGNDTLVFTNVGSFKDLKFRENDDGDLVIKHKGGTVTLEQYYIFGFHSVEYIKVGNSKKYIEKLAPTDYDYLGASPDINSVQLESVSWKTSSDASGLIENYIDNDTQINIETLVFAENVNNSL